MSHWLSLYAGCQSIWLADSYLRRLNRLKMFTLRDCLSCEKVTTVSAYLVCICVKCHAPPHNFTFAAASSDLFIWSSASPPAHRQKVGSLFPSFLLISKQLSREINRRRRIVNEAMLRWEHPHTLFLLVTESFTLKLADLWISWLRTAGNSQGTVREYFLCF